MALELYYLEETDSICSNRVIVTLSEKGITDWIPHHMILMNRDQFTPEYLELNPNGTVPTLVHNGAVIRESSLICKYIDGLKADPPLSPDNLVDQIHMAEWIKLFDERGFAATGIINFVTKFRLTIPRNKLEERWKHIPVIDRLHRQQSVIGEGLDSLYVLRAIGAWETIFRRMEKALADGRPYLMGEQLTLAETNAVTFMKVIQMLRFLDFWLEPYPMTKAWWDRVSGRPSVQQLDKFASNAVSEDSPHAKAGRETEAGFREKIAQYREQFPHAQ